MPILKDFRNSKEIILPSWPDSKVEIYDALLVGDQAKLGKKETMMEYGIDMLPYLIKSWNFTDEQNNPIPINKESLNFLKENDVLFLLDEITNFAGADKKKEEPLPKSPTA